MSPALPKDKAELRREILARRKALGSEEAERLSLLAQRRLLSDPVWRQAGSVALYAAAKQETQTWLLLEEAWAGGKNVYLPRVAADSDSGKNAPGNASGVGAGLMHFAPCAGKNKLIPGAFGIPEPDAASCPACIFELAGSPGACREDDAASGGEADNAAVTEGRSGEGVAVLRAPLPDLFVIPGLAFDRQGHRLGWGGGYYDRYLAGFSGSGPKIIALAYSFQLLDSIPFDAWDKPVDAVCTDKELLWTS